MTQQNKGGEADETAAKETPKLSFSYRPDIDGLRALAVFSVFVFHAFPEWLKGGFVGVDVFFVISGFLISSIIYVQLSNGNFSFWGFYSRRIRRIYPVLVTVLLASFAFGWFYLMPSDFAQLSKHAAGGAAFVSNIVLRIEGGYFGDASALKPLLHFWSLAVEEQFYIIWPLLLWAAWKKRINLFYVCLAVVVVSFGWNMYWLYKGYGTRMFFLPQSRFWELIFGAMLGWLCLFKKEQIAAAKAKIAGVFGKSGEQGGLLLDNLLSVAGFVLLIVSVVFAREQGFPGFQALMPVVSAVLLIAAGSNAWLNKHVLGSKILVWFGLISYPMYLWHWPILSFERILTDHEPTMLFCAGAFVATVMLAWVTTQFIERPLRFGDFGVQKTVGLFIAMLVIGVAGFVCFKKEGFINRLPHELRLIERVKMDGKKTNPSFGHACHANNISSYQKKCKDTPVHPSKPTVALWGDSHMGGIANELRKRLEPQFNVFQRSGNGCPRFLPFLDEPFSEARCPEKTKFIAGEFKKQPPDYVIWTVRWREKARFEDLKKTIDNFKSFGVKQIIVIGPTPEWHQKLPKLLLADYQEGGRKSVATHLPVPNDREIRIDEELARELPKYGVKYISIIRKMCDGTSCRVRGDGKDGGIFFFDMDHVTEEGAQYLVSIIAAELQGMRNTGN